MNATLQMLFSLDDTNPLLPIIERQKRILKPKARRLRIEWRAWRRERRKNWRDIGYMLAITYNYYVAKLVPSYSSRIVDMPLRQRSLAVRCFAVRCLSGLSPNQLSQCQGAAATLLNDTSSKVRVEMLCALSRLSTSDYENGLVERIAAISTEDASSPAYEPESLESGISQLLLAQHLIEADIEQVLDQIETGGPMSSALETACFYRLVDLASREIEIAKSVLARFRHRFSKLDSKKRSELLPLLIATLERLQNSPDLEEIKRIESERAFFVFSESEASIRKSIESGTVGHTYSPYLAMLRVALIRMRQANPLLAQQKSVMLQTRE